MPPMLKPSQSVLVSVREPLDASGTHWGDCQNFKVIGPEEMPILIWGAAQAPPN